MTDRSENGRIDLRAIDEPVDPLRAERIVAAAVSSMRGAGAAPSVDVFTSLAEHARPMLAAAAVLLLLAAGAVISTGPRVSSAPPASLLAGWAESQHVPTNGELLAAFRGYGQ